MRQIRAMRTVLMVLLLVLCGRLYYVQILCADELTAAAQGQQMIPVLQENGKGVIYDRNKNPLTGTDRAYYYLIHKNNLTAEAEQLLVSMETEPAGQKGEDYLVYRTTVYRPSASYLLQKKHRAYGFSMDVRYGENQAAAPLVADLDQMYDALLQKRDPAFHFLGNAAGGLIHGRGVYSGSGGDESGGTLMTTLDLELQKTIEAVFAETGVSGCAVVTDCRTGQVLAMVSRGGETDEKGAGVNLAVEQAYPLGKAYALVQKTAVICGQTPADTAPSLGMGMPVFENYPGEDTGVLDGKRTTATAVQVSQALATIASGGNAVPLTLVMSAMKEKSIPCMEMTGDEGMALEQLCGQLAEKPLIGDGWAVGYSGTYAIVVYLEEGEVAEIYSLLREGSAN